MLTGFKNKEFVMTKRWILLLAVVLLSLLPAGGANAAAARPSSTRPPAVASSEEVRFHNKAQDLELAGQLFLPQSVEPYPAVVIVHGSGDSSRDNRWIAALTAHLQGQGIAVLVPDKRGSGASGGDWRTASFAELATDTAAALHYLHGRDDLPISAAGVVGSSQGGHISPLIAATTEEIDFIVNLSGATLPIREVLRYEEGHNLRQMGLPAGLADLLAYPAAWSLRAVRQKAFWDAVGDFDPLPYWRGLELPALVLYGAADTNVPAARSAARLAALGKPNIEVRLFAGSGHNLGPPSGAGAALIRPAALQAVSSFIDDVASR